MNTDKMREQFDLIAKQYDEGRKCFIPCLDDFYGRSVSLLRNLKPAAEKVVDLGAGTGLLTKTMYLLYPQADFTLVDLSNEMLDVARQRFDGLDNFQFEVMDYTRTLPAEADIICSALSIHHLEDDDKVLLYRAIYEALPEGGIFLNLDQFCADSPAIDKAWSKWWMNYIDHSAITDEAKAHWLERKKLDREVSLPRTMEMLKKAGFQQVECFFQYMKFASFVACK